MPRIRVVRPHTFKGNVVKRNQEYDENERVALEKVRAGVAEFVKTKMDPEMYGTRVYDDVEVPEEEPVVEEDSGLEVVSRSGNWYFFSDGEKALGRRAAAEKLGVMPEELPDVPVDDE